jgi:hypothetical protein
MKMNNNHMKTHNNNINTNSQTNRIQIKKYKSNKLKMIY